MVDRDTLLRFLGSGNVDDRSRQEIAEALRCDPDGETATFIREYRLKSQNAMNVDWETLEKQHERELRIDDDGERNP